MSTINNKAALAASKVNTPIDKSSMLKKEELSLNHPQTSCNASTDVSSCEPMSSKEDTQMKQTAKNNNSKEKKNTTPEAKMATNNAMANEKSCIMKDKSATMNEKSATMNEKSATMNEKSATMNEKSATMNEKSATMNEKSTTMIEKSCTINEKSATMNEKSATMNEKSCTMNEQLNKTQYNNNEVNTQIQTNESKKKNPTENPMMFSSHNQKMMDPTNQQHLSHMVEAKSNMQYRDNKCFAVPLDILPEGADIAQEDIDRLHRAHHDNPFGVLGAHQVISENDKISEYIIVIRVWLKDAEKVAITFDKEYSDCLLTPDCPPVQLDKRCDFLFQKAFKIYNADKSSKPTSPLLSTEGPIQAKYKCHVVYAGADTNEYTTADTYNFGRLLPTYDLELFQKGSCWHVDNLMGSHKVCIDGVWGIRFSVWAPNCLYVSVVGDFNQWDGRAHPMRKLWDFSVWELFIPNVCEGQKYGYRIHSRSEADFIKIDPYAQEYENPPQTASVISSCDDAFKEESERFKWTDDEWMKNRRMLGVSGQIRRQPMSIYEVHLPSWMRGDGNTYLSYRELAKRLVEHVKAMNFTHVEFLPLAHHPFEGSWGYQVTGQYAPYSRLGTPDDFKYLVNTLHENNVGVFLDFVPAHFCKDAWGLVHFDGEPCYEYADPREGEHKTWGTMVFNYRRTEVRSFLLGAAYHWLRRYHIDGLRIDAVSSMIYRDHLKKDGEWIPNEHGGHANIEAISLLQELNWVIHREFPGVFTMAEESTSWKGVTDQEQGLGFDAKWDLGWMNDTLTYLCCPIENRRQCHNKLTFRGLYMAHERWIVPLSHDEVVSGKGSLLDKCGFMGTPFEIRIRALKTLYGFQIGIPGRPLLFMGGEIAQGREWKENRSVDWHEGEEEMRKKLCVWLSDLLNLYKTEPALHAGDDEVWNFKWSDCENAHDCVLAFIRSYKHWYNDILVVCNFNDQAYHRYPVGVPHGGEWTLLLNSDDWKYAGGMTGMGNASRIHTTQGGRLGWPYCLWLDIPPSGCLYLKAPQPAQEVIEKDLKHDMMELNEKLQSIELDENSS